MSCDAYQLTHCLVLVYMCLCGSIVFAQIVDCVLKCEMKSFANSKQCGTRDNPNFAREYATQTIQWEKRMKNHWRNENPYDMICAKKEQAKLAKGKKGWKKTRINTKNKLVKLNKFSKFSDSNEWGCFFFGEFFFSACFGLIGLLIGFIG